MSPARFLIAALLSTPAWAASPAEPVRALSREILRELIEMTTTDSVGSTTVAAEAVRQRAIVCPG